MAMRVRKSRSDLYVGGRFTLVDGHVSTGIAWLWPVPQGQSMLEPQAWHAMGKALLVRQPGLPGLNDIYMQGFVHVLLPMTGGNMLVGGSFNGARDPGAHGDGAWVRQRNLGIWRPASGGWQNAGVDAVPAHGNFSQTVRVSALAIYEDRLWVGGNFSRIGDASGQPHRTISAHGLGTYARALEQPGQSPWADPLPHLSADVRALLPAHGDLYAGGYFLPDGGDGRALLRWHEGMVQGLEHPLFIEPVEQAGGAPSRVLALASSGRYLCMGGTFSRTTSGEQVGNLDCRDLLDGEDLFPGRGVNDTGSAAVSANWPTASPRRTWRSWISTAFNASLTRAWG